MKTSILLILLLTGCAGPKVKHCWNHAIGKEFDWWTPSPDGKNCEEPPKRIRKEYEKMMDEGVHLK